MDVKAERRVSSESAGQPRPLLGLAEAVALIVGVVIGAGIFKAPSVVASLSGSPAVMFAAWLLGGALSLVGALCYAELATAYANAGGDYHFLRRAFGRSVAFLYGWARFSVITTGSIALLAFVFGDYMQQALPLAFLPPGWGPPAYAGAAILLLSLLNLQGIRSGAQAQNWLTLAQVAGLLLVAAAAFHGEPAPPSVQPARAAPSFGLAMVFVLLTYGGWNEAAYISAELRDGRRNMVRALSFSIVLITAIYLIVTLAYWRALGMQGMAASGALAADVMRHAFGAAGETAIALLVAVSALTSINATMIAGARTGYAMGVDWAPLAILARWDQQRGTPVVALLVQCGAALLLVAVGTAIGSGFQAMVEFTAPVFWLFFLLTGIALFVLRRCEPARPRPYRVPLFPLLPLLFCATCAYMLWSSLSYVYSQTFGGLNAAWIGLAMLAVGVVLLRVLHGDGGEPPA